ncbi:MAG: glycosyltransferase [Firmicutes bacterium]|jgi:glycosyltransferase involved in cell wall biosynthesis|nr:glycosyltransferase [Bacillota bacterium]MDH7475464.1 glycosyltransferase [Anaerolineae bacterium]
MRLSVIIPTLNEATYLPILLDALAAQTRPPDEIIVADAGSCDGTAELAQERGARVVHGGMPAAGRNAGARVATGNLFLFLDADVVPPSDFIARAVEEFEGEGYAIATSLITALDGDLVDQIAAEATNLYLLAMRPISPHAPGFCILVQRAIHEKIGGFDETLRLSEDHDYARRATRYGKFGILTTTRIPVSMRRVEKEGLAGLGLKYAWCEMYALAGKPVRAIPFEYEFGAFGPPSASANRPLIDVDELRQQLGRFANPLQRFSRSGREQLTRWVEIDAGQLTRERIRRLLARRDLDTWHRFLQQRLALTSRPRAPLRKQWSKLKTLPRQFCQRNDSPEK